MAGFARPSPPRRGGSTPGRTSGRGAADRVGPQRPVHDPDELRIADDLEGGEFPATGAASDASDGAALLIVTGRDGNPARGARVWFETPTGRRIELGYTDHEGRLTCTGAAQGDRLRVSHEGELADVAVDGNQVTVSFGASAGEAPEFLAGPRLVIAAGVTGVPDHVVLRLRVTASDPLLGPPLVSVSPDFGAPLSVPMTPAGPFS